VPIDLTASRAVVATLALVVVLVVSAFGSGSWAARIGGAACASAAGAHAGLVVDFGTVTSVAGAPSSSVEATCLPVTGSDELGSDLLAAAGHTLRWQGGLLCAIDGYPATGCGVGTSKGYQYWSYWHGGSTWTYSSVGPSSYRISDGSVEGWRFVEGSDSSNEGTPRMAPAGPCPPPAVVAPPPSRVLGASPGSGAGSTGSSGPVSTGSSGPGSTIAGSPTGSAPTGSPTTATTATPGSSVEAGSVGASGSRRRSVALGVDPPHPDDSDSPAGAVGAVGAMVALALAAVVITRHRAVG
jgi:hypothetical protein